MDKQDIKDLKARYLIWFYRATREALEKTERKFSQIDIDRGILKELNKLDKPGRAQKYIGEFRDYISNKEKDGMAKKYANGQLSPDYYFLAIKLEAIEKVILAELGRPALLKIKKLYHEQMVKRILEERQEKV
jgi:hypothetical protein